jgi:hypothetical protein
MTLEIAPWEFIASQLQTPKCVWIPSFSNRSGSAPFFLTANFPQEMIPRPWDCPPCNSSLHPSFHPKPLPSRVESTPAQYFSHCHLLSIYFLFCCLCSLFAGYLFSQLSFCPLFFCPEKPDFDTKKDETTETQI